MIRATARQRPYQRYFRQTIIDRDPSTGAVLVDVQGNEVSPVIDSEEELNEWVREWMLENGYSWIPPEFEVIEVETDVESETEQ